MYEEPIDPDVDLRVPPALDDLRARPWSVIGVIAAGGMLGSSARYGLQYAFPHPVNAFAWATFAINVSGCLLIGALMVLVTEVWTGRPLLRPFVGVGVLGGFTTFSTYVVDIRQAIAADALPTGLAYLAGTLIAALAAVWLGTALTRRFIRRPA